MARRQTTKAMRQGVAGLICAIAVVLAFAPPGPAEAVKVHRPAAHAAAPPGVALRSVVRCRGQKRRCPFFRSSPRLYSHLEGQAVRPLLTGNSYGIYLGRWYAYGPLRLSVEWLTPNGRVLGRGNTFTFPPRMSGAVVLARACGHTAEATTCAILRGPERVRTPTAYLKAACGSRRPAAPPYDPNFELSNAPGAIQGWSPCKPVAWAIDDYGEPPLLTSNGDTWRSVAAGAVAQLSAATGIEFFEQPNYNLPPGTGFATRPSGVDIGIAFEPLAEEIGGLGGATALNGQFIAGGGVEINSSVRWDVPGATDTILHELGHAMGLGHPVAEPPAPDPKNAVMDPAESSFLSYQPGDLCGLYEAVWRAPCGGSAGVTLGQGVVPQGGQ